MNVLNLENKDKAEVVLMGLNHLEGTKAEMYALTVNNLVIFLENALSLDNRDLEMEEETINESIDLLNADPDTKKMSKEEETEKTGIAVDQKDLQLLLTTVDGVLKKSLQKK